MIFVEYVGVIMDIHGPAHDSRTHRVTHLTLDVARVEMRYQIW